MLTSVFVQKFVELVLVSRLNVAAGNLSLRSANFLLFNLSKTFLEIGEIGCSGQEHEKVFVYVFERSVYISSEFTNQFCLHIVFHSEESEVLSQIVNKVERSFFLQLLTEVLLSLIWSRLIRTESLGDL